MFENKQLRKEKKIFKELRKKFNKAFLIEYNYTATDDIFTIDGKFVIVCDLNIGTLEVSRKDTKEKIVSIDCKWRNDSDSSTKSKLLRDFIKFAEKAYENFKIELAEKQAEDKRKQQANEAAMQARKQKQIYMTALNNALSKLK